MPRAFTEEEKARIRERLLNAGRTCFTRYGLKKTTIDDLVRSVGIAKSSFYLFFESKEALYIELLMAEVPAMIKRLIDVSFGTTDDTREALVRLLKAIVYEIETNEFVRALLDAPDQLERLMGALDFDDILKHSMELYVPLLEEIEKAQERGEIIPGDPQQILYSLGMIKLLPLGRDGISEELYRSLLEFLPQVIADGLTCPTRRKKEKR
jgi:AcrR family transcriptional regulator